MRGEPPEIQRTTRERVVSLFRGAKADGRWQISEGRRQRLRADVRRTFDVRRLKNILRQISIPDDPREPFLYQRRVDLDFVFMQRFRYFV